MSPLPFPPEMSELAPTINDAESPDDIASFGWSFWPEHVLSCLDLLLVHCGAHEKLVLPPVYCRPKKAGGNFGEPVLMRPAIPSKAITAAMMLLWLQRSRGPQDGKLWWHLSIYSGSNWKSRLALAGIDCDTLEVVDRRRWAFAFAQLCGVYNEDKDHGQLHPSFKANKQIELINSSLPTPELKPRVHEFKVLKKSAKSRLKKELKVRTKVKEQQAIDYGFGNPNPSPTDQYGRPFSY
jgi:hypothetical protein